MTTKEQMLQTIRELPGEATTEDAMERLYLLYKVDAGSHRPMLARKSPRKKPAHGWRDG